MTNVSLPLPGSGFELRFDSLFRPGCALAFPCDSEGHVDDEHLGAKIRHSHLFAPAMVGREYKWPRIMPCPGYPARPSSQPMAAAKSL